jgi:MFS family permease/quinol monooxygenase YgiN
LKSAVADSAGAGPLARSLEPTLWSPLRVPMFRKLLIADVLSDIGTFMQGVGAAWLMVSLGAGPLYVALIQTASSLAFFMLALPAGSVGDIVDRRRLILFTEIWMAGAAALLAALTFAGAMTPWLLLAFTFAISAGDALETPTWRATLPELVPKADLAAASALNGIEFNLARAVGPAFAGTLIAIAGVGAAFAVNAVSFVGVIWVVAGWKRPSRTRVLPAETITGATVAALRYVRHSPGITALTVRSGIVMFFASAILALLPSIAHRLGNSSLGYGFLLGCFGAGAIVGALLMQPARARWSMDAVVSTAIAVLGVSIAWTGMVRAVNTLGLLMLLAGATWIAFISLFSALVQRMAPDWVRARVVAVFMLVFQGGLAAGSAFWGLVAERAGVDAALLWAGVSCVATAAVSYRWQLPTAPADVSPWNHWRMPDVVMELHLALDDGPVLVTIEYSVDPHHADAFRRAMEEYEHVRRRDGASRWGLYRDIEVSDRYVETFVVGSWAEHLRQHARLTQADRELEERVYTLVRGQPKVEHLIDARQPIAAHTPEEDVVHSMRNIE